MTDFNPAVQAELLEMYRRDQAFSRLAYNLEAAELLEPARAYLKQLYYNTERLKQIIAEYGWPGYSLVESPGAQAAWLIAQHADHDRTFQKQVLALLEVAVQQHEADVQHWAYLTDRVRVGEGLPQLYGTQFFGDFRHYPPILGQESQETQTLDARRLAVGLPPLQDYLAQMEALAIQKTALLKSFQVLQEAVALEEKADDLPNTFLEGFRQALELMLFWINRSS